MGNKKPVEKSKPNTATSQPVGEPTPVTPADATPVPPAKKRRKTEPAQLPTDLVEMADLVASHYKTTIGKLLDPQIRPWLTGLYARVLREKVANLPPGTPGGEVKG